MPVLFEGGDPEFEPEKLDVDDLKMKRGRKLIRVGLLMLVLGLVMCLFFIILVVIVVPASLQMSANDEVSQVLYMSDDSTWVCSLSLLRREMPSSILDDTVNISTWSLFKLIINDPIMPHTAKISVM